MVLLHIVTHNVKQAREVAVLLTEEKLALNALIQPGISMVGKGLPKGTGEEQTLVMAQTKGLLFDTIDKRLRGLYKDRMPILYSVPIINMDWEQADLLKAQTARI